MILIGEFQSEPLAAAMADLNKISIGVYIMTKSATTPRIQAEEIIDWFSTPQIRFLGIEEAIAYVLHSLFIKDSYGTGLINDLDGSRRISDTVLYAALNFLTDQKMVTSHRKRSPGRGRPRRIYSIDLNSPDLAKAREIATCWHQYLDGQSIA